MRIVLVSLLLIMITGISLAEEKDAWTYDITPESLQKVVDIFEQDPLSEDAVDAFFTVLSFLEKHNSVGSLSGSVTVRIKEECFPWYQNWNDGQEDRGSMLLFGAYIIGDVKAQLEAKVNKDQPYAGARQVISTYQKLRNANVVESIPEIEKWIQSENDGKLKDLVADFCQ